MPTNNVTPGQSPETSETICRRDWCTNALHIPEKGRHPVYCSEGCRQADYRDRRNTKQRLAEAEQRHQAVAAVIEHALALELPTNSRVSATKRRETAEAVARHLRLAYLVS